MRTDADDGSSSDKSLHLKQRNVGFWLPGVLFVYSRDSFATFCILSRVWIIATDNSSWWFMSY